MWQDCCASSWVPVREPKASFRQHETNRSASIKTEQWCEDSLDLLALIDRSFPSQPPGFHLRGKRFLCLMNYSIVLAHDTLWRRLLGYLTVARAFDCVASPWTYAVYEDIRVSTKRSLRNLVAQVVNR